LPLRHARCGHASQDVARIIRIGWRPTTVVRGIRIGLACGVGMCV